MISKIKLSPFSSYCTQKSFLNQKLFKTPIFMNSYLSKNNSLKFSTTIINKQINFSFSQQTQNIDIQSLDREYVNEGYSSKLVGYWLLFAAGMILGMICLGGYTRLSKSGLSMTKWKAFGYKMPANDDEWEQEFVSYKATPEYQLANKGMSLQEFKKIFKIEFYHRYLGNFIGYVFGFPLLFFLSRGYFTKKMKMRLLALFGFGGFQGLIGWWMVKSGFKEKPEYQSRPRVSTYRLLIHNCMAVALYSGVLYHAFLILNPKRIVLQIRKLSISAAHIFAFNLISGVVVAGIDAGKVFNTWPTMNGSLVPSDYWNETKGWKNLFENCSTTQFNHRMLAYISLALIVTMFLKSRNVINPLKFSVNLNTMMIFTQVGYGIFMLLNQVPVESGVVHQGLAIVYLSSLLFTITQQRRLVLQKILVQII